MSNRLVVYLATICLAAFYAVPVRADLAILQGLAGRPLSVVVEPLDVEARQAGLSETGLAKIVAGRLAARRIKAGTKTDTELFIRVVTLTSRDVSNKILGYGAHVELSVREPAYLHRDKTRIFMAPTWFKGGVTVANPQLFVAQTNAALTALADQFVLDYLAANPPPAAKKP